ncbi:hypothetical protein B0T18DRAFT_405627 [Schizothecium vesticola]|uniref:Uncharacterized protein n=1 Tax=Schizothecium vesticola TaxID=314040 RepID=A0AA40F0M5_9PEZI|nr:hypothetical protein B0T18DRAFT_405627 [Schizothecium vesticola]
MKKISTTDSAFARRAYENGILNPAASYPPPQTSTPYNIVSPNAASTPSHPSAPIKSISNWYLNRLTRLKCPYSSKGIS